MTPEGLQQQLTVSGHHCRIQRGEVQVETCLYCGNTRWNLELNAERGLFHCWACNTGGRLDTLLRQHLGYDVYIPVALHKPPPRGPDTPVDFAFVPAYDVGPAAKYLLRRGLDAITAKQYGLVVCTEAAHLLNGRLVFPLHDFWTNVVVGYVGRSFTGRLPKYLSTVTTRMIGGYRAQTWPPPCVIVEGFFDGIAVHRAGYHAVVLAGIAGGRLLGQFIARIPLATPLLIMLDGAAQEQALLLQQSLQPHRYPQRIPLATLPTERDPADFVPTALRYVVEQTLAGQYH